MRPIRSIHPNPWHRARPLDRALGLGPRRRYTNPSVDPTAL